MRRPRFWQAVTYRLAAPGLDKIDTFPQIFIQESKDNFIKIGGYDNLMDLLNICSNIKNSDISINAVFHMYKLLYKK